MIICVLRSGGEYTARHVARLREQIPPTVRMTCLTNMPLRLPGVTAHQLVHRWPGWWSKIEVFRPYVTVGPTIYLDLDSTIHGDITQLYRDPMTACTDFIRPGNIHSSVMAWKVAPVWVYDTMRQDPNKIMSKYRRWPRLGDQALIQDTVECDVFEPGLVRSYRKDCQDGVPPGTIVVTYHGRPKPWELESH